MCDLIRREDVIEVLKETGITNDADLGRLVTDEIARIPATYDTEKLKEKNNEEINKEEPGPKTVSLQENSIETEKDMSGLLMVLAGMLSFGVLACSSDISNFLEGVAFILVDTFKNILN